MKTLVALMILLTTAAAQADPLTIRVSVLDEGGREFPAAGARVAMYSADAVVIAEEALAGTVYTADGNGVAVVRKRPSPDRPLILICGMALRAIAVARVEAGVHEAKLILPAEAVLKVVVRDSAGRAVSGAEVLAAPEGPLDTGAFRQPGTVLFREFTDSSGTCLFYRMDAGARYRIRVGVGGAPAEIRRDIGVTQEPVEVFLSRGAVVRGKVIAVPGGTPVPGALVAAGEATSKTDEKGEFELTGVKPGLQQVQVTAAGRKYTEDLRIVVRPGETRSGVLLRVQGLGRLAGRLLGPDTRPAAGAEIYLRYPPLPELLDDLPPGGLVQAGRSDDEGRFDLEDLLPAQGVDLIAIHPSFAPAVYYGYSILAGQSFETLILFRMGGGISGSVIAADGAAVAEAEVWALDGRDDPAGRLAGRVPLPLTAATAKTGPDGSFALQHVAAGSKTLVVTHPEHLPLVLRGVEIAGGDALEGLVLTLGRGTLLRGTVLGVGEKPARGAVVTLTPAVGSERTTVADEGGVFLLAGVPPGTYRLTVTHPGHVPYRLPRIVLPVDDLAILLEEGHGLEGRVLLADGSEAANSALVRLLVEEAPDPLAPNLPVYREVGRLRASAPDASFLFINTPPGRYRLEAWTPDGRFGFIDGLVVSADTPTPPVELRVRGGWGITGVVLTASTGGPLEGARVALLGPAGTADPHQGVTDENGVFTIPSVSPGFHSLRVEAAEHSPRIVESVQVRRGIETMVPEITLDRGSRVRGSVRGADGRPLRGMLLRIHSSRHRVRRDAETDEWGEFTFRNVSAGQWLLTLEKLSVEAGVRREQRLVTVVAGEDLHLDLRFGEGTTLTGRVTRAGLPVSHALLEVFPLSGELVRTRQVLTSTTDADGAYRVTGLPAGPVLVLVASVSGDSPPARFRVEIEAGPEVQRNLMLPLSGIRGLVENLDSGEPVPGALVTIEHRAATPDFSFRSRVEAVVGDARSREDGTFFVEGLPAGLYRLVARMPGFGEAVLDTVRVFDGGLTPVRILLPPAGRIRGRVVDDAGRPVTGALVTFARSTDGEPVGEGNLRTDSAGRFQADFLAPGSYLAAAEARGYGRGLVPDLEVSAGGAREIEIRLAPEGRLKISVYGPGGTAIEGARISIRDFWGHTVPFPKPPLGLLTPWRDPAVTTRDGSVTVSNLAPGVYEIRARHADLEGPPLRVTVLDGELARAALTLLPPQRK